MGLKFGSAFAATRLLRLIQHISKVL